MKKFLPFILLFLILSGCATTSQKISLDKEYVKPATVVIEEIVEDENLVELSEVVIENVVQPEVSSEIQDVQNVADEKVKEKPVISKGMIFAKTDFQGVLKASYVKLFFKQQDGKHEFQMHIGAQLTEKIFPWNVMRVEPGYFFIELPVGKYKIVSISIPVGTTMASEDIDIDLEVAANVVTYVGTLKIVGTKEKIKLGGVPLIKPGFEYVASIVDEHEDGNKIFRTKYTDLQTEIRIHLMKINQ